MAAQTGNNIRSLDVVLERIDQLRGDVGEVKDTLKCVDSGQINFQRQYAAEHAQIAASVAAAHRRLDDVENFVRAAQPLIVWQKFMAATVIALISALIGLSVSIATGQISLVVHP